MYDAATERNMKGYMEELQNALHSPLPKLAIWKSATNCNIYVTKPSNIYVSKSYISSHHSERVYLEVPDSLEEILKLYAQVEQEQWALGVKSLGGCKNWVFPPYSLEDRAITLDIDDVFAFYKEKWNKKMRPHMMGHAPIDPAILKEVGENALDWVNVHMNEDKYNRYKYKYVKINDKTYMHRNLLSQMQNDIFDMCYHNQSKNLLETARKLQFAKASANPTGPSEASANPTRPTAEEQEHIRKCKKLLSFIRNDIGSGHWALKAINCEDSNQNTYRKLARRVHPDQNRDDRHANDIMAHLSSLYTKT